MRFTKWSITSGHAHHFRKGLFGTLQQGFSQRPLGRDIEEVHQARITGLCAFFAQEEKFDELDGGRITGLFGQGTGIGEVALEGGADGLNGG